MDLMGRWVSFAVRDIYLPAPEAVLMELHGHDVLSGEIVDVSDSGAERAAFVVVRIERLAAPVVVPADRTRAGCRPAPAD
jgi:hypothetical protein